MYAYLLEDGVAGGGVSVVRPEVDLLHGAGLAGGPVHQQLHLAEGALALQLEIEENEYYETNMNIETTAQLTKI